MTVLDKLSSAFNRRDEVPNQELAQVIAQSADKKAVNELVENLRNKSKAIQNDCIKVLYEIGELKPDLIANYLDNFLALLNHKNNRLQWGAMTALNCITTTKPKEICGNLLQIMDVTENGSVITRDYGVNILINLASVPRYAKNAISLLIEQLLKSPTNQLPMYAERALPIINEQNKRRFVKALKSRVNDVDKESKRKRIEKVIKKLSK